MPTDPKRISEYDDWDLQEVLLEVQTILASSNYTDVIWAGDLNWDMARVTFFSRTMAAFVEKLGLVSLWSSHPVNYTYVHTDNKSVSTIDHFLLSPRLLHLVEGCGVVERGDNLSGHCPIWVSLNLGSLPLKKGASAWVPMKPAWAKATQDQVSEYTSDLEQKLLKLNVPLLSLSCEDVHCQAEDHSNHRDSFMLDILLELVECSYTKLHLSGGSGGGAHGGKGKAQSKPVCGTLQEGG